MVTEKHKLALLALNDSGKQSKWKNKRMRKHRTGRIWSIRLLCTDGGGIILIAGCRIPAPPVASDPGATGCCCRRAVAVTEGVGAGRLAVAAASDCGDAAPDACLGDEFVQRGASSSVRPWSTSHPRRLTRRRAPPAPNSRGFFFLLKTPHADEKKRRAVHALINPDLQPIEAKASAMLLAANKLATALLS